MTRRANDAYGTPAWCVYRMLEAWDDLVLPRRHKASFLEPHCGGGNIVRGVNNYMARNGYEPPKWITVDIAPTVEVTCKEDFFGWTTDQLFDLAIGNPPYKKSFEHVKHLVESEFAQETVLLLPLTFLSSEKRRDWLTQFCPDVLVLPNRPSFTGDGKVMSTDYGWFRWKRGVQWIPGVLDFAELTPIEERRP